MKRASDVAALVTIGMPVFNNGATLRRAISSVRAQSMTNWQLRLTDDGSTDDSVAMAIAAAQDDPRIRIERNPARLGYMNFGQSLRQANTPWFSWLAADDFWAPDFLDACLSRARMAPHAVSILPVWALQGQTQAVARMRHKPTGDVPRKERLRRFLSAPGGSRIYGLMKTRAAQAAFPPGNMHAWDWYFMLGLLQSGPQIELDGPARLFRDETLLAAYSEAANQTRVAMRSYPALSVSRAALAKGWVPFGNLPALFGLNMRMHEEFLIHILPHRYARWLWFYRTLGFPIATRRAATIAASVSKASKARRKGAQAVLDRLIHTGQADAARIKGELQERGILHGDPDTSFARAADLGDADAAAYLASRQHGAGTITDQALYVSLMDACAAGSIRARDRLLAAYRADALPLAVKDVLAYRLRDHLG